MTLNKIRNVFFVFIAIFSVSIHANTPACINSDNEKIENALLQGNNANIQYTYCEFSDVEDGFFKGKQSINLSVNNHTYSYTNDVDGMGYFGGQMFFSELGVFGIVEATTGNAPLTVSYLTIIDNELVLLGKVTFDLEMGHIVGSPYIESKNDKTNAFIKRILESSRDYLFGDHAHTLSIYEGLLFVLYDDINKDITTSDFNKLSYKLSEYPSVVNFYRQKIFFKDNSLCVYNENTIEMDAFGCQINNKQLSLCYDYFNNGALIYRYGKQGAIELELEREIEKEDRSNHNLIFEHDRWQYEVNTDPLYSGILISENGNHVSTLKCDNETVEFLLLDPIWQELQ